MSKPSLNLAVAVPELVPVAVTSSVEPTNSSLKMYHVTVKLPEASAVGDQVAFETAVREPLRKISSMWTATVSPACQHVPVMVTSLNGGSSFRSVATAAADEGSAMHTPREQSARAVQPLMWQGNSENRFIIAFMDLVSLSVVRFVSRFVSQ